MIIALVTFPLASPRSAAGMKETFLSSAPRYRAVPGLLRKNYWVSEDGLRAGGVYFWDSKASAERCYSGEWRARVGALYGVAPQIEFLDSPVMVEGGQVVAG